MDAIKSRRTAGGPRSSDKSFECEHPGCNKRFTRAEHLQRHALNHAEGGLACSFCQAHFKRPDLLKRHMERHRQKDIEAGGPGFGVLDTRKRAWKAPDGSVVEKRPCLAPTELDANSSAQPASVTLQEPSPEPEEDSFSFSETAPITIPRQQPAHAAKQAGTSAPSGYQAYPGVVRDHSQQFSDTNINNFETTYQNESFDSADHDPWTGSTQYMSLEGDFPWSDDIQYDQIFQPDTASSFNMPYTTALDYNWLFNVKDNSIPGGITDASLFPSLGQDTTANNPSYVSPESINSSQLWPDSTDQATFEKDRRPSSVRIQRGAQPSSMAPSTEQSGSRPSPAPSQRGPGNAGPSAPQKKRNPAIAIQPTPPELEKPFSMLIESTPVPELDESVRQRLLDTIDAANPTMPDMRHSIRDDPLLSLSSLQNYLDLYFRRFNTAYPLMHMATFRPRETEPLLLLSILLLGATYSGKDSHQLAVCIHDVIRPSIFAHAGFSPRPDLWALQTILLVECFGKSRAGQKQHDMSHLFHGLLINLIRRSDCQSVKPSAPPLGVAEDHGKALGEAWERWAIAEQKKRLALLCFMWDTQHAVLFCQSLCMSAFELRVEMPCSQSIWEARDAVAWASSWRTMSPSPSQTGGVLFLAALKSYLSRSAPRPTNLSGLSRILILHGLMSVAWDMQRRDQTSLGVVSGGSPSAGWRNLISTAYDAWKADFDTYHTAALHRAQAKQNRGHRQSSFPQGSVTSQLQSDAGQVVAFAAAYNALYHSAQALLNMDFLDVQIYAGARHILGRPVQQKDYLRSARIVKQWAYPLGQHRPDREKLEGETQEVSADIAAWHSARLLHESASILEDSEAMSLFHVPWCLYLVTLTCWAYQHARPRRARNAALQWENDAEEMDDLIDEDEMIWDPQADMKALVASMAESAQRSNGSLSREQHKTNGLVWTVAEMLTKVRWGIVHAGVVVLRGLVPQRLINQYDDEDHAM